MSEEIAKKFTFTEKESKIFLTLTNLMSSFVVFYFVMTAVYLGIAIFVFFFGFDELKLHPHTPYVAIPIVIALVALYLARELYFSRRSLRRVLHSEKEEAVFLGRLSKRLRNYFFVGALFLFFMITFFILIIILILFNVS